MQHEGADLIRDGDRIVGVEARSPEGPVRIDADLVVACDGRHSTLRRAAGLEVDELGVPIDVLWFRISRYDGDPEQLLGNVNFGKALVLINRGDYFQAGLIVRKGSFDEIQAAGIDAFRDNVRSIAPYLGSRVNELESWDQVKLLTVQINRLRKWYLPGLLVIGDAAHAMSPAGGVGINLAIQDAVAAANLIGQPLREGLLTISDLARVQQRREFPTRATQLLQANAHKLFSMIFRNPGPIEAPWQLQVAARVPGLPHLLGRVVGMGVRPEHVADTDRPARPERSLTRVAVRAGAFLGAAVLAFRLLRR
jgi:2-polyprenyl-6-methoxyphenol hydroxylase-like FAD-dependent oxidoreductase